VENLDGDRLRAHAAKIPAVLSHSHGGRAASVKAKADGLINIFALAERRGSTKEELTATRLGHWLVHLSGQLSNPPMELKRLFEITR
jgi:hypothetical protein